MAAPPRPPPDDPALLVRAALVCKRWCRLISSPGFRRRFRELHRTAPMLGFFCEHSSSTRFVPTASSSIRLPYAVRPEWRVLSSRPGRLLVLNRPSVSPTSGSELIVWDPSTDEQQRVPMPPFEYTSWSAILLCSATGCDHIDGHRGSFLVVFVCSHGLEDQIVSASVYSSEQNAWSHPISVHLHCCFEVGSRNVQVHNAVYFTCENRIRILEYHLGKQEISMISPPPYLRYVPHAVLMKVEDGGLGFALVQFTTLSIWSREDDRDGYATWAPRRVVELNELLPLCDLSASPYFFAVAIADDVDVIFFWAHDQLFTIDLRSSRVKKVDNVVSCFGIVPYVSFYTPELGVLPTLES